MKYLMWLFVFFLPLAQNFVQHFPPAEIINTNPVPGKYISRTMNLMETSEPGSPNAVRIMIYGQSITRMDWWLTVREYLSALYPSVILNIQNYAIGGFDAGRLIRCVERDVLEFYPDLIIFHDYGNEETYEEIIRMFRSLTTAEVLVLNDHMGIDQNNEWHDRHSWKWLPAICGKYGLEMVDVRTNWIRYAEKYGFDYQEFLADHVHMNKLGNYLMAEIITAHLVYDPKKVSQTTVSVNKLRPQDASGDGNHLYFFSFTGNRLDLIYPPELARLTGQIYINHLTAENFPGIYIPSRAYLDEKNAAYPEKIGIPVRIILSDESFADHWEMVVKNVEGDGYRIYFDLYSRLEGFQGSGDNLNDFCSRNGKICLKAGDWFYREEPGFFSPWDAVEAGDTIRFDVKQLNYSVDDPPTGKMRQVITGLPDGINNLKINGEAVEKFGNGLDVIVYDPPLFGKTEE